MDRATFFKYYNQEIYLTKGFLSLSVVCYISVICQMNGCALRSLNLSPVTPLLSTSFLQAYILPPLEEIFLSFHSNLGCTKALRI